MSTQIRCFSAFQAVTSATVQFRSLRASCRSSCSFRSRCPPPNQQRCKRATWSLSTMGIACCPKGVTALWPQPVSSRHAEPSSNRMLYCFLPKTARPLSASMPCTALINFSLCSFATYCTTTKTHRTRPSSAASLVFLARRAYILCSISLFHTKSRPVGARNMHETAPSGSKTTLLQSSSTASAPKRSRRQSSSWS